MIDCNYYSSYSGTPEEELTKVFDGLIYRELEVLNGKDKEDMEETGENKTIKIDTRLGLAVAGMITIAGLAYVLK